MKLRFKHFSYLGIFIHLFKCSNNNELAQKIKRDFNYENFMFIYYLNQVKRDRLLLLVLLLGQTVVGQTPTVWGPLQHTGFYCPLLWWSVTTSCNFLGHISNNCIIFNSILVKQSHRRRHWYFSSPLRPQNSILKCTLHVLRINSLLSYSQYCFYVDC